MSQPKGILIQSNFLYHVRHKEIVMHWFTNGAILKFFELVISTIAVAFSCESSKISHAFDLLILCYIDVNWIVCLVLYSAHFLECPAPPYVDLAFSTLAAVTGLAYLIDEIFNEPIGGLRLTAILALGMVVHFVEIVCIIWLDNCKNILYRYLNRKRRPTPAVLAPKELRKKGVKFTTAPDTYREPSLQDDSDEDDYLYPREIDKYDDKYVHVRF